MKAISAAFLMLLFMASCLKNDETLNTEFFVASVSSGSALIDEVENENVIAAKGGSFIRINETSFYIGYRQIDEDNQDPVLLRYDNGFLTWMREDYETTEADNTGYGLLWDGDEVLYAVFSATAAQGSASDDFRRFATEGWLNSYGQGEGAEIAVLARIDVNTGDILYATYLSSVLLNGNTNSLRVRNIGLDNDKNLIVEANAMDNPRKTDKSPMACQGESPFDYTIVFSPKLRTAISASSADCK